MTLRKQLAALDRRLVPGRVAEPSASALLRVALMYFVGFFLMIALALGIDQLVDKPDWLVPVVSGAGTGLLGALLVWRLVRPDRK